MDRLGAIVCRTPLWLIDHANRILTVSRAKREGRRLKNGNSRRLMLDEVHLVGTTHTN